MGNAKSDKLGARIVFNIVTFGFIGQVAWAVENNFFNLYLFKKIGGDSDDIALMVACSAVVAVLTTLVMGTLSDKLNRRKIFLSGGYILWGFTVMAFAAISRENVSKLTGLDVKDAKLIAITVSIVIVMDCIMTFMGSTSNDAAFNAWITDVTTVNNRAKTEGLMAILPVLAMVLVTVAFAAGVEKIGYPNCFIILGLIVIACGVVGLFSVKDSRSGVKSDSKFFSDLFYGFRPSVVRKNKGLYLALSAMGIFAISTQVFFPYLFIYIGENLGLSLGGGEAAAAAPAAEQAGMPWWIYIAAVAAIAVVIGGAVSVGSLIDKMGKSVFVFPASAVFVAGLVLVFFAKSIIPFAILAVIMLVGYGLLMIILNAAVRDFTPEDKVGQFQGIRMIFSVMLPMLIGPAVGSAVTKQFATKMYENDYAELVQVPPAHIFIAAAAIAVFIFIPLALLKKTWKAKEQKA